uniref:Uncharacterized protein n=1 Tax=Peronospora matthiolae TaxID=2874970 RepID=A0AAV1U2A9_9STRA
MLRKVADPQISAPDAAATPSIPTPTSWKRDGSTDPKDDVQKRQRHTEIPAAVTLRTSMSSAAPGTLATIPSTGTDRRDVVAAGFVQHGTVDARDRQREQAVVCESRHVVEEFDHEVHGLRDRVARPEGQPDLLLRVPRLVASPTLSVQAPRDPSATDQDKASATLGVFASCVEG